MPSDAACPQHHRSPARRKPARSATVHGPPPTLQPAGSRQQRASATAAAARRWPITDPPAGRGGHVQLQLQGLVGVCRAGPRPVRVAHTRPLRPRLSPAGRRRVCFPFACARGLVHRPYVPAATAHWQAIVHRSPLPLLLQRLLRLPAPSSEAESCREASGRGYYCCYYSPCHRVPFDRPGSVAKEEPKANRETTVLLASRGHTRYVQGLHRNLGLGNWTQTSLSPARTT
jgi:hypothetical protein